MILSSLPSIILGAAQGCTEGVIINTRTRKRMPPMPHTWSVVIRILWVIGLTFLLSQFRDGTLFILFLALWFAHMTGHRFGVNLVRGMAYKVKWFDMGRDWYDGMWVALMSSGDLEDADEDDEAKAFICACLVELALSATLYLVLHKLTRP